jgi:hypothetical protein
MLDVRHEQQPGRQPVTLLTLDEISSMNPMLVNAKIRIDRDTQQASVIDVIKLISGRSTKRASEAIINLSDKLSESIDHLRIDGTGKLTPVCDAKTMVEIIWELPGKAAKAFRRQCAHYIVRILGGDASLVEEMRDRADASTASQRDFFIGKRGTDDREKDEAAAKRLKLRREEDEMTRREAETQLYAKQQVVKGDHLILQVEKQRVGIDKERVEMQLYVKQQAVKGDHLILQVEKARAEMQMQVEKEKVGVEKERAEMQMQVEKEKVGVEKERAEMQMRVEKEKAEMKESSVTFYRDLVKEMFGEDAHMQAAFKDYAMVTLGQGSTQRTSLAQFAPDISTIITDMGFRGQSNPTLCRIGKAIAKAYRETHGTAPKKTEKYVNGSVRKVNAYMQSDVDMMQAIIRKVLDPTTVEAET